MPHLLEMTYDDLKAFFAERYGKGSFLAGELYREYFKRLNPEPWQTQAIRRSPGLSVRLERDLRFGSGLVEETIEQDGVVKLITRLADGHLVESVVIRMATHETVCVSCQVGCRMGCRFCETAKMGLIRNLTAAEISGQVLAARQRFDAVRNVVFMGMGEPMDNFGVVVKSIQVLNDQRGFDIAQRHITISTVGLTEGIQKLSASGLPGINLAISLNAADNRLRDRLMPINRMEPLEKLQRVLMAYPFRKGHGVMVNYVLIPGVNDSRACVKQLAEWLLPLRSRVNLIPFNPGEGHTFRPPDEAEIETFRNRLIGRGVNVQQRHPRGRGLMAACGQLGRAQPNA